MRGLSLLESIPEEDIRRFQGDGLVQADAVVLWRDFCDIGDIRARRLIRFRMDCVVSHGNNVGAVFDLEFEWSPPEAVGDRVASDSRRCVGNPFHVDDQRVDFVMLAVIRDDVDDGRGVGLDENFLFECSLFHAEIIPDALRRRSRYFKPSSF